MAKKNKKKRFVVGVDLGGTKILAALLDERYRVLAEVKAKTKPQKGEHYFLNTIKESIRHVIREGGAGRSEIVGVGLGCPGIIDARRGVVKICPNIPFLTNYPLAAKLQRALDLPVVLGNDVKTGLYGEHQLGAAKGKSHVLGIFIGTGIGGAMILNGQLYTGSTGGAGEIGHMQVDPQGPLCGCGQRGCFEAMASRLAVATAAAASAARQRAPWLMKNAGTQILEIKSGTLAKAIRAGDRAVAEVVRDAAQIIGRVTANVVNLLNPEMVVIGGGLTEALASRIIPEITKTVQAQALPGLARHARIVPARLKDYSIVMGAAKMARDRFYA